MAHGFKHDGTTRGSSPAAWRGHDDLGVPEEKWTNESGWVDLWAPPRGYAVYVPT